MLYNLIKVLISAVLIVIVAETSKRSATFGGLLGSLPLISLFAIMWLYLDTHDTTKVADYSWSVFWFVLPSLPMFLLLPWMLRSGWGFALSITAGILVTCAGYVVMAYALHSAGVKW